MMIRIRFLAVVVVFLLSFHALALLAIGGARTYQAVQLFLQGPPWDGADRPGIHIAESVDALLFALVLLVLAIGTTTLFLGSSSGHESEPIPSWMRVKSLTDLKMLLWEGILLTLVVAAMTDIMTNIRNLSVVNLILPGSILVLSVSYFLLKKGSGH
ncbi:MAG: YqhA family protein [Candidatus Eiseniibacteriota bacterium]